MHYSLPVYAWSPLDLLIAKDSVCVMFMLICVCACVRAPVKFADRFPRVCKQA